MSAHTRMSGRLALWTHRAGPQCLQSLCYFMAGDDHIDWHDSTIISWDFFHNTIFSPKDVSWGGAQMR